MCRNKCFTDQRQTMEEVTAFVKTKNMGTFIPLPKPLPRKQVIIRTDNTNIKIKFLLRLVCFFLYLNVFISIITSIYLEIRCDLRDFSLQFISNSTYLIRQPIGRMCTVHYRTSQLIYCSSLILSFILLKSIKSKNEISWLIDT